MYLYLYLPYKKRQRFDLFETARCVAIINRPIARFELESQTVGLQAICVAHRKYHIKVGIGHTQGVY